MSRIKKILLPILAALMCTMLALGTIYMLPKGTKVASANNAGSVTADIVEYANENGVAFNYSNLQALFGKLVNGSGTATYDQLKTKVDGRHSTRVNQTNQGFTAQELSNLNGSAYDVMFGGMRWIPVFLSETTDGDVILTLWQSSSTETVKYTMHTNANNTFTVPYPQSMYSTSYLRAYIMGTPYSENPNVTSLTEIGNNQSATWKDFRAKFSGYIATPNQVEWQLKQSVVVMGGGSETNWIANEACGKDGLVFPNANGQQPNTVNSPYPNAPVLSKPNYYDWGADVLWVPSYSETGILATASNVNGYWMTSAAQRANSVATWTRTSGNANPGNVQYKTAAGAHATRENGASAISLAYSPRPAFHLNLTKVMQLTAGKVTTDYTGSNISIEGATGVAARVPADVPWYSANMFGASAANVKLDYKEATRINIGTYHLDMTIQGTSDSFSWAGGGTTKTKSIEIEVVRKKLKAKFPSSSYEVVSGNFSAYPTASFTDSEIAGNDKGSGPNAANYPNLKIYYTNDTGTPFYSSYDYPIIPGDYIATAVIDPDIYDNCNYDVMESDGSSYQNYVNLKVKPVEITKPYLTWGGVSDLTYTGSDFTATINAWSDDVIFGSLNNITYFDSGATHGFTVSLAGTYAIPIQLAHPEYMVWSGTTSNADTTIDPFEIKKVKLYVDFLDNGNPSIVDFRDGGEWGHSTEVKFKISVAGEVNGEEVYINVYYTGDSTQYLDPTTGSRTTGREYILPGLAQSPNDYQLVAELADTSTYAVNRNYEIVNDYDAPVDDVRMSFKIGTAQVNLEGLVWGYTNAAFSGAQTFDDDHKVTYNGYDYTVLVTNTTKELTALGLRIESSYYSGDVTRVDANEETAGVYDHYVVTLFIQPLSGYVCSQSTITFEWYIERADVEQTNFKWQYYIGTNNTTLKDVPANGEIEYASSQINIVVTPISPMGTPYEGIRAVLSGQTGRIEINGYNSTMPLYTVTITNFVLDGTVHNYNVPTAAADGFVWSLNWKIVMATLTFEWTVDDYPSADEWQFDLPRVTDESKIVYKYYSEDVFNPSTFDPLSPPADVALEDIYDPLSMKGYYAVVFIKDDGTGFNEAHYRIDYSATSGWFKDFTVGSGKFSVKVSFPETSAYYDGELHATADELTFTAVNDPGFTSADFIITYYTLKNDGSRELYGDGTKAPKEVGSYYIVIALNPKYEAEYMITAGKVQYFDIKKVIIDTSNVKWGYSLNGGEYQEYVNNTKLYFTADENGNPLTYTVRLMGLTEYVEKYLIDNGYLVYTEDTASDVGSYRASYTYNFSSIDWDSVNFDFFGLSVVTKFNWQILKREITRPDSTYEMDFDGYEYDVLEDFCTDLASDWGNYLTLSITRDYAPFTGTEIKHAGVYRLTFTFRSTVNSGSSPNVVWDDDENNAYIVTITIKKIEVQITAWTSGQSAVPRNLPSSVKSSFYEVYTTVSPSSDQHLTSSELVEGTVYYRVLKVLAEFEDDVEFTGILYVTFSLFTPSGSTEYLIKPTLREKEVVFDTSTFDIRDYIVGFRPEYMQIGDGISLTQWKVGKYTITISPYGDACWKDGEYDPVTGDRTETVFLTFEILQRKVAVPKTGTSLVYNGEDQTYQPADFDARWMSISDNVQKVVGNYNATVAITDNPDWAGCVVWEDGTTGSKTVSWSITPLSLPRPTVVNPDDIVYSPKGITINISTEEQYLSLLSITGNKPNTAGPGTMTVAIAPEHIGNVVWATGTGNEVTLNYTVKKAQIPSSWNTAGNVPSLTIPSEYDGYVEIEYVFTDPDTGATVSRASLVKGKSYTVYAQIKTNQENYEFTNGAIKTSAFSFDFGGASGGGGGNGSFDIAAWLAKNWWWILIIVAAIIAIIVVLWILSGRRRRKEEERREEREREREERAAEREQRMMEMFMHSQQSMPNYQMPMGQQPLYIQLPQNASPQQLQLPAGIDEETLARAISIALSERDGEPQVRTEYIHTGIDDDDGFYDDYTGYEDNGNYKP